MSVTRALGLGRAGLLARVPQSVTRSVAPGSLAIVARHIQIESVPASSEEILNRQRLRRPSSPHFTIYQPQITWIASIANRVTGVGLSVGLYGFLIAYLAAPIAGIPLDSAHIVEFVQGVPEWLKYSAKGIIALPFTFHSINGLRHLSWDVGKFLSVKAVYRTGYTVVAASVASAIALVLL